MPQLFAPLCLSLAVIAGGGQEMSTHTLRATVSFAPRTSLTVSTSTLRFVVSDPGKPAYATVNFSAAARTIANGEVTLVIQMTGDAAREVVLSISGGSDGVLVGYAGISRLGRMRPYEYEIHTIGVDPEFQGQGIGRRLLDDLLDYASGGTVFLEVRTDNEPAIALYESVGFVNIGLRKRYYRASGADAYTMQRLPQGGPT